MSLEKKSGPNIYFNDGKGRVQKFIYPMIIGCADEVDIKISGTYVSRHHALLVHSDEKITVKVLSRENCILITDMATQVRQVLKPSETISLKLDSAYEMIFGDPNKKNKVTDKFPRLRIEVGNVGQITPIQKC